MKALRHAAPYLLSLLALLAVALPILRIQPGRQQSELDLSVAHVLTSWNEAFTLLALALGLVLAVYSFRALESKAARFALLLPLLVLVGAAGAARVNVYEKMFAPVARAGYVAASEAVFLSDHDLVLGVSIGEKAAAYPVGMVAYHHIVNDRLQDEPFVVTY